MAATYQTVKYGSIETLYLPQLEGGGTGFGQTYVPIVRELFGKVGRVHEFCAGPGFIGFSLLAHGLCDSLCLSDINPVAVAAARETVRRNGLGDRVSVYLSDALEGIPPDERWDLVVSNPPHFRDQYQGSLRHFDPEWSCHRNFYRAVGRHLSPGASVLIQENYEGSEEADFRPMVREAGLHEAGSLMYRGQGPYFDTYYFLWSRQKGTAAAQLPEGKAFTRVAGEPTLLPVEISPDRVAHLRLAPYHRCRLRIANRLGADASLLVYAMTFGVVPRFLRSAFTIGKDATLESFPFQMFPGQYRIRDSASRRTVVRITVA